MKFTAVTDIFFDLDHTLWDFEINSTAALKAVISQRELTVNFDEFMSFYSKANAFYWELFRQDKITQADLRFKRFDDVFKALDLDFSAAYISDFSEAYLAEMPNHNLLIPGAMDLLNYLFPKYDLHIITNGFAPVQANKIKNSNIAQFFKTVTDSETTGFKKPNPIIYNHALKLAQVQATDALMVGDCIVSDVKGAQEVGMQAIWFDSETTEAPEGVLKINHLSELKNIL